MSQRLIAACAAVPLVLGLLVTAAFWPLPYVSYQPGLTLDVLGRDQNDARRIQVDGHKAYYDAGQLRMTTVSVSTPEARKTLFDLLGTWFDGDDAVYPYDSVYGEDESNEDSDREGAIDMVTSQDNAVAVAETELGFKVTTVPQVAFVDPDSPAEGKLEVRDIISSIDGTAITLKNIDQISTLIRKTSPGDQVSFGVIRDQKPVEVSVPTVRDPDTGNTRTGISIGVGYKFPFDVAINISPDIGGPSAGLMFSLAVYDTLTPGALTGGETIAGTGTIAADGTVGPIGGIQQKIVGAREAGAKLFMVPADNCNDTSGAHNEDMRLVKATTMHEARLAIEAWVKDPDATLPSCSDSSSEASDSAAGE